MRMRCRSYPVSQEKIGARVVKFPLYPVFPRPAGESSSARREKGGAYAHESDTASPDASCLSCRRACGFRERGAHDGAQATPTGSGAFASLDRGIGYASGDFQRLLGEHGIACSMPRKGNGWDNACIESIFGRFKKELIHDQRYASHEGPTSVEASLRRMYGETPIRFH